VAAVNRKPKRQRATPQSKVTKDRAYIELDQEPLPTREMTFDEKHALTMSLQELPESKQEMVITIVQEGTSSDG
jgi:DNA-directed RNA polymerase specialized sigma24 family protein